MRNLFEELMQFTDEELAIIHNQEVKKDLYTSQSSFVIEGERFLKPNKMIMVRKHTRFIDFPKHKHDYIEINYVYHGKLTQHVAGDEITLKKGELLFLNQHIEHEIEAAEQRDIVINFIIRPDFFEFIFTYLDSDNKITEFLIDSLYNQTHNGHYLYFKVSEVEEIQQLIGKMIEEIWYPSVLSQSSIKLYMGLLIIELIKHVDKLIQKQETQEHYVTLQVLNYIEDNYQEASLEELAKQLNQPSYWLSKHIKKSTNQTFKTLLQDKRLRRAKELLEVTTMPIVEIAEQVGYDNISYFYRIFKGKYDYTPSQYRNKMRG
ncbi:AraC family transcriptional regulator [Aquibacillus salsiterrae]|uniref:AraC family transcriptional regulator n=1 Tax=Aquibacillus salsiterrae TaxID=2950439 RepID=A0A9X3WBL4_9BACI|nr:AraC family transcriptional regulator [Aquibacillus salsiterrae]MDC3416247.1 AraC family transcriptional regulator [Aquibacillus salsiterrae]